MPRGEEKLCTLCAEHVEAAIQSRPHVEGKERGCLLSGVIECRAQVQEEVEGYGHFEETATTTQLRALEGKVSQSLSRAPCISWPSLCSLFLTWPLLRRLSSRTLLEQLGAKMAVCTSRGVGPSGPQNTSQSRSSR